MTGIDRRETPPNQRPTGSAVEAQPVCWPLLSAQEMRELDRHAIDVLGVPAETLMENAGRAVAEEILREVPSGAGVSIICGRGNNGGDGLVAARHLHRRGVNVLVIMLGDGQGNLIPSDIVGAGGRPWMLATGDVDGDGDADVASAKVIEPAGRPRNRIGGRPRRRTGGEE